LGRLRSLRRSVLDPRIDELLRLFSLWEDRHSPLSSYSKGMRQKILISGALTRQDKVRVGPRSKTLALALIKKIEPTIPTHEKEASEVSSKLEDCKKIR
jgi:ABC-type Na+ transport system ATPase subunit NatA